MDTSATKQIVLAVNPAPYPEGDKKKRQDTALTVLRLTKPLNVRIVEVQFEGEESLREDSYSALKRNSRETIGNNRDLPYIWDIFDFCSCFDSDIIGYMNSDILLPKPIFEMFNEDADAYILYRREINKVTAAGFMEGVIQYIWGGDEHPGNDAFFFDADWWMNNRDEFPKDLVLGETEWDTVYREVAKHTTDNYLESRSLFHVFHEAKWSLDSPGALNNIKIWEETKRKYGI